MTNYQLGRPRTADEVTGELIHQLMWRQRMPQRELAATLHVDQSSLSKKLRGERSWTLDELIAAAQRLGVPAADLLPGNDYAPVLEGRGRKYAIRDSNPEPAD